MIDNELQLIMMLDAQRKIMRDREFDAIEQSHDRSDDETIYVHDVRRTRVINSQQDLARMITVDDECTVDLDSVHTRKILRSHKIARIESDRQRHVRAQEQAFRDDMSKIKF